MIGTYRHLTQCATAEGHFVILAIDHRDNLRTQLDQAAAIPVSDAEFADFKLAIVTHLASYASAVLIDPEFGIGRGILDGAITGRHGLLSPLEVTNYDIHPSERILQYIDGWSVKKIKRSGGTGVKLLLPFHPDADSAAEKITEVALILAECQEYQLPFFMEPIAYALNPDETLSSAEKRRITLSAAQTFSALGVDILKMEFPVHPSEPEAVWIEALAELNAACGNVPWTLLSAGVDFPTFLRQTELACQAGASGVIVGRAVWAEAVKLQGAARLHFLQTEATARMQQLAEVCTKYAYDWRKKVEAPTLDAEWYK